MARVTQEGDETIVTFELANPSLVLDLTSDRCNLLAEKQASRIIGLDVIHPGRFAPEGGRRVVEVDAIPAAAGTIVDAFGESMAGRAAKLESSILSDFITTYYTGTTTSLQRLTEPYAWPSEVVGATIIRNSDSMYGDAESRIITGRSTTTQTNDTITWSGALSRAWLTGDKVSITYSQAFDKRGIWVTDGRRFYLVHAGSWALYLDLGSDSYLGERWTMARISSGSVMFVNPKYPPRVVRLDSAAVTESAGVESLAGLITPVNPDPYQERYYPSWQARIAPSAIAGYLTAGYYKMAIRMVNLLTGAESRLVGVRAASSAEETYDLLSSGSDCLDVFDGGGDSWRTNYSHAAIPLDPKWTHVEVYRTTSDATSYYLEARFQIPTGLFTRGSAETDGALLNTIPRSRPAVCYIPDLSLIGQPLLTATDFLAGYPPPICKQAASLGGVTVCAGKADDAADDTVDCESRPWVDSNAYYYQTTKRLFLNPLNYGEKWPQTTLLEGASYVHDYGPGSGYASLNYGGAFASIPSYPPLAGGYLGAVCIRSPESLSIVALIWSKVSDDLVTISQIPGGVDDADVDFELIQISNFSSPPQILTTDKLVVKHVDGSEHEYTIASATDTVDGSGFHNSTITFPAGGEPFGSSQWCRCYIKRTVAVSWPKVSNDEEVWYSRTDKFAPESFLLRTLTLSREGDEFRGMTAVGNYIAVVMAKNVHLLYLESGELLKDTVSVGGDGTPWPRSIVSIENVAVWATPTGPRIMRVSNTADSDGHRGVIVPMAQAELRSWFDEAFRSGYDIDAGIDVVNSCVRFRRTETTNSYQVVQLCIKTGRMTLLDDDNGVAYALSRYAKTEVDADDLHSVTSGGRVFKVNDYALTTKYSGCTVQAVAAAADLYVVVPIGIAKTGAFSATMAGEMIRFRSTNAAVDGVSRVIRTATADAISFDSVPGLTYGDEFIIGAVRFKTRFAPLASGTPMSVKTIHGVSVKALPGIRVAAGVWSAPATGQITVRSYQDYSDTEASEKDREIKVFQGAESGFDSEDRESAVVGQGQAIELEIEHIEARSDFTVASVVAKIRDDDAELADADTA